MSSNLSPQFKFWCFIYSFADKQNDIVRHTDRQTQKQTDRQTDRKAGNQAGRQVDRKTDRQTHRSTDRQTDRQLDGRGDRQTGRGRRKERRTIWMTWMTDGGMDWVSHKLIKLMLVVLGFYNAQKNHGPYKFGNLLIFQSQMRLADYCLWRWTTSPESQDL